MEYAWSTRRTPTGPRRARPGRTTGPHESEDRITSEAVVLSHTLLLGSEEGLHDIVAIVWKVCSHAGERAGEAAVPVAGG